MTGEELNLQGTHWDCCVVGNGVSALWIAHWLWSSKRSVLWITSEEPYSPSRAMLQHAWLWGLSEDSAKFLTANLKGFDAGDSLPSSESIYYDARSAKRFRRFGEAKQEWGPHEKDFFTKQATVFTGGGEGGSRIVDLWDWHARLHAFHDIGQAQGPTQIELFNEPRFVRVQGWPVAELKTGGGRVTGVVLAGRKVGSKKQPEIELSATSFYLGDFDEFLPGLIRKSEQAEGAHDEKADSDALAGAIKGRSYRTGFGLRLWHKPLGSFPVQTAIIPLVANPSDKDAISHVTGRFIQTEKGLESYWVGFLNDEELEDNNEILKKIKLAKRAVERAIPGFSESITREAVSFEPRMRAEALVKKRATEALGAVLISDHYGTEVAADTVVRILKAAGAGDSAESEADMATVASTEAEAGV